MKDSIDNLLKCRRGEECANKLTQEQAMEILRRRNIARGLMAEAHKLSNTALAEKYNINKKSVDRIINGHRWKGKKIKYGDMTMEDAETLRAAAKERDRLKSLAALHSVKVLAKENNVSESLVSQIATGDRWIYLNVA